MDFLLLSAARHTNLLKAFMSQFEVFIIMIFGVFQNIFHISRDLFSANCCKDLACYEVKH